MNGGGCSVTAIAIAIAIAKKYPLSD